MSEQARDSGTQGKRHRKRWPLWVAAALLLIMALLPFAGWEILTSSVGARFVREEALAAARREIAGRLEIGRVSLSGLLTLELDGVKLYAPGDSAPVVTIDRVVASVRAIGLLGKRLDLAELTLAHPVVDIVPEDGSTNLARALASKKPPSPPAKRKSRFTIHAPNVRIDNGALARAGARPLAVAGLDLAGALDGRADALTTSMTASAHLLQPIDRAANLSVSGSFSRHRIEVGLLSLAIGDSSLRLHGHVSTDLSDGRLTLDALRVAPADVEALWPKVKLARPLSATGAASLTWPVAQLVVRAQPPVGKVIVYLDARLARPRKNRSIAHYGVTVVAKRFEPRALLPSLPAGFLNARLTVDGTGLPGSGSADVQLDASGSRYQALALESAKLMAHVVGTTATIRTLHVVAAGTTVDAQGQASRRAAALSLNVEVTDLERLEKALPPSLTRKLPPMSGAAALQGHVEGPYAALHGELSVTVPRLAYADDTLSNAQATVKVVQLSPPLGSIPSAHVGAFAAGTLRGRALDLTATLNGHETHVSLKGDLARVRAGKALRYRPVALQVDGKRLRSTEPGAQDWRLDRFAVSVLGISLASEQPATIEIDQSTKRIDHLLVGGSVGRFALSGEMRASGALRGELAVDRLRLDRIPKALLPTTPALKGTLSGSASVRGTLAAPAGRARLRVVRAGYGKLAPVSATLAAKLEDGLVTASLEASIPRGGRLAVTARLPASSPRAPVLKGAVAPPIAAKVSLDGIDLAFASLVVPKAPKVSGRLAGTLALAGTWQAPDVSGLVQLENGQGFGVDRLGATASLRWRRGRAALALDLTRPQLLEAHLDLSAPLSAEAVLAGAWPNPRTLPLEATVSLAQADLGALSELHLAPAGARGLLAGKVHMTGTLREPRLDGTLAATAMTLGRYRDLDATLELSANHALQARLLTQRAGRDFVTLDATVQAPASRASELTTEDWLQVPVDIELRLMPTALARLWPEAAPTSTEAVSSYGGDADGRLSLTGSADAPILRASFEVPAVTLSGKPIGAFHLTAQSAGARTRVAGDFTSRSAGSLQLDAALAGSFSAKDLAAAGRARLVAANPQAQPTWGESLKASEQDVLDRRLDASIQARKLDLALLNGVVSSARKLGGRLDASLSKHGPLRSPRVDGRVALVNGSVAVPGFGTFDAMKLELNVAWPRATLADFSGRSGTGTFRMNGALGPRAGTAGLFGDFHARLDALPIVEEYQTRGYLSLRVDAPQIVWKNGFLDVPKVLLSKGLVRIPEQPQKDVQSLAPNPDFVIAGTKVVKPAAPWKPRWKAQVGLVVPDDFRIDAPLGNTVVLGAKATARVDEALAKDGGSPFDLKGRVSVVRGTVQLPPLPPQFEVQPNSALTFYSRQYKNPTLDVTARYQKANVTVTATITGTLDHPIKNFTSKPSMDESEILYFLATGQVQNRAQTDPFALSQQNVNDTLTSLATSIGSGIAKSFLNKYLGGAADIDVLSVGAQGSVKLGTYFWNGKLYIGGERHPNANILNGENTWEVDGEYRFNDTTFGRLKVGDQNHDQLELIYQNNFPSKDQKKAGLGVP